MKSDEILRNITTKLFDLVVEEMNKPEMRDMIRFKFITPLLRIIYNEVSPYIYAFLLIVFCIFTFSLLTFIMFISTVYMNRYSLVKN